MLARESNINNCDPLILCWCCFKVCISRNAIFSVCPEKFGTMFYCELDFCVSGIPTYFTDEEIKEDCAKELGKKIFLKYFNKVLSKT